MKMNAIKNVVVLCFNASEDYPISNNHGCNPYFSIYVYYLLDIEKDPFSLVNKSRSLELTESIEEVEYSPGESRNSFIMNNNIYHHPNTYF